MLFGNQPYLEIGKRTRRNFANPLAFDEDALVGQHCARCHIDQGLVHTDAVKPKERNHLSDDELRDGWRMACQTFVLGDVSVSWVPREPPAAPPPASGAT